MKSRLQQAKEISLMSVLHKLGYEPAKSYSDTSSRVWYNSPFRGEAVASFIFYRKNNSWYDWGSGKGGDVIDFVREYNSVSVRQAIDYLLEDDVRLRRYEAPKTIDTSKEGIGIVDVKEIENKVLLKYASTRGIDTDLLRHQCKEVHYCYYKRDYITHMAIGFQNDKGGWELRNHKQKVCNAPKTFSTVRGVVEDRAVVFEGFFDFLSYLQINNITDPRYDSFIMNSLVFAPFIVDEVERYGVVDLYFDNDGPADDKIKEYFVDSKFRDKRGLYYEYEDINDYLIAQKQN